MALSSCIGSRCYTWWPCQIVGFPIEKPKFWQYRHVCHHDAIHDDIAKMLVLQCEIDILALSSCISSRCYTWCPCQIVGFPIGKPTFSNIIKYSIMTTDMMTIRKCWFYNRKVHILALSSCIASRWLRQRCRFPIGKQMI